MVLSCVVVFCTTYALILPAITMEELSELTEPERTRVESVMELVAALPDNDTIAAALADFEAEDNSDGYDAYLADCVLQAQSAYAAYEELSEAEKAAVENSDKLLALNWLYEAETLAESTLTVYAVDNYQKAVNLMVRGKKLVSQVTTAMSFTYWDAIIVEKNSAGQLYVKEVITADVAKGSYSATTDGGFVLLLYNINASTIANVNDYVAVSFYYTSATAGTNDSGYGTVTFSDTAPTGTKADKNNTDKLKKVESASTRDFIELNLYDYSSSINDLYESNKKYPVFQQDTGQQSVSNTASSNFGNNITEDLGAGISSVTNQGGDINKTTDEGSGVANAPISGAMQNTLGADGYPALADGTSLSYLFSNSKYATKQNKLSIDGLFIKNNDTGAYTFNSRENHAQFNATNDTFTLYDQIISSNAFWYPFGNFLPFNDIVHESQQASELDRDYLLTIVKSAQAKAAAITVDTEAAKYTTLANVLTAWIGKMDEAYPSGWGAAEAMNEYFKSTYAPGGKTDKTFDFTADTEDNKKLLQDLYSIDFDEETDFYFGMEMKMNFFQTKDGLTGNSGTDPMVFYFTGDDDVWVYIDGVLFLDLSGIHRHVGGEIDFVNGLVKYYYLDVETGDVSTKPYKTVKFSDLVGADKLNAEGTTFEDYSSHSFNLYYMERGAGSGVCRMNFNFPLLKEGAVSVTKKLDSDVAQLLGDPDFKFQILKANDDGLTEELLITEGTTYTIYDNGVALETKGKVGAEGVFTLKAGQTAAFEGIKDYDGKYYVRELLDDSISAQYGTVTVDGSVQTKDESNVTIDSQTFTGVNSPLKEISSKTASSTVFEFTNTVDKANLGSLSITKELTTYSTPPTDKTFNFEVKLDDKPLPVKTTYTVGGETRTVEKEGIISLAPGETAVISHILAGTKFSVQETAESQGDYLVSYKIDGATVTEASGTIGLGTTVSVTVNNSERAAKVEIPIQKTLANPDGKEHTYSFTLTEVNADGEVIEGGHTDDLSVAITDTAVTGKFTIYYPYISFKDSELPKTFTYRVTEDKTDELGTVIDSSEYIVKVELSESTDGNMTATITHITKDGLAYTDTGQLGFVNRLAYYELPETGGTGTLPYIAGGLLLIFGALLMYYKTLRRKEDGSST